MWFGVGFVVGRDAFQVWCDTGDVGTHWCNDGFYVAGFIGGKPITIVVFLEVGEKLEETLAEAFEFNTDTCSGSACRNVGNASSKGNTGRKSGCAYGVLATGS